MKQQLLRYWLAMNASAIRGAAHAGKTWLATAGVHAIDGAVPALNLNQFLAVLGFTFALGILDWLDKNPLPEEPEPEATGPTSETRIENSETGAAAPPAATTPSAERWQTK
jgi:hypothetical protein